MHVFFDAGQQQTCTKAENNFFPFLQTCGREDSLFLPFCILAGRDNHVFFLSCKFTESIRRRFFLPADLQETVVVIFRPVACAQLTGNKRRKPAATAKQPEIFNYPRLSRHFVTFCSIRFARSAVSAFRNGSPVMFSNSSIYRSDTWVTYSSVISGTFCPSCP